MNRPDYSPEDVRRYIAARLPELRRTGGEWRGPCPVHKGERDSFSMLGETGASQCFSACARGWNLPELERDLNGGNLNEAHLRISALVGNTPQTPPAPTQRRAKRVVARYDYTDETGKLVFQVERMEPKDFRQRRPGPRPDSWLYKLEGVGRGLPYRLPDVIKADRVFVVEGEKDVATLNGWGLTATCNAGGAGKWNKEHARHFKGKEVVVLPDNDDPGRKHAVAVAVSLKGIARRCRIVALPDLPDNKGDVTDWKERGGTKEALLSLVNEPAASDPATEPDETAAPPEDPKQIPRFRMDSEGVWLIGTNGDDKRISPPLHVDAMTRQRNGTNYGKLVRFRNREGKEKTCIILDADLVAGDGREGTKPLVNMGFRPFLDRGSPEKLREYLYYFQPERTAICVSKVGWDDGTTFVLPDRCFGPGSGEQVIFEGGDEVDHKYRIRGDLQKWKLSVGRLCVGNTRLVLAVSAAFAAPLLDVIAADTVGFHFCGTSSIGKSTTLLAAGSVWGGSSKNGFLETWNGTVNGFEARAALHNDALLCLDEISEITDKTASELIYALGNGLGKMRMNKHRQSIGNTQFKLVFLSTGERTLREILESAKKTSKGGQEVRMLQIPADAGKGLGTFENVHGFASPGQFADAVIDGAKNAYGAPIQAYLQEITGDRDNVAKRMKTARAAFVLDVVPSGASGEVGRAAKAFGMVAAAGEYATDLGLTSWQPGEATAAARSCFRAWIEDRGGTGSHDVRVCIENLNGFIHSNPKRFQDITKRAKRPGERPVDPETEAVQDRAGLREQEGDGWHYYIFRDVLTNEICRGYDYKTVANAMIERGWLHRGGNGRHLTDRKRIPGTGGLEHVFHVTPKFFAEGGVS